MGEGLLVGGFSRLDGTLVCENTSLEMIASAVGTPVYVYSAGAIREQYARLASALAAIPHRVHYSMKANSSRAILELLRGLGAGVDIGSGGGLFRAQRAGVTGRDGGVRGGGGERS